MTFSEFYCDAAAGSNINAGDKTANGVVTSTNGAWSTVTNIFTAAAGTPFAGVTVGDFASVYVDGATVTGYIGRVTNVGGGGATLTISSSVKSGIAPTTAANGISCTTGGAWQGPNGSSAFPLNFVSDVMVRVGGSTGDIRINMKNGTNYAITAVMDMNSRILMEGYTSTAGDGGKATIDGGTSGASYNLINHSATRTYVKNMIFQNNGATGNADGVTTLSAGANIYDGCVFHDLRGYGLVLVQAAAYSCEFYNCNQSATADAGAFRVGRCGASYCVVHDNTGAGFVFLDAATIFKCISDSNTGDGLLVNPNNVSVSIIECDFYNNGGDGIDLNTVGVANATIVNCNFVKNGAYGIRAQNNCQTKAYNCGFGSGTQANSSGTSTGMIDEVNPITYTANTTPWVDPANGDFRINSSQAKGTGRGNFTQTAGSYTGSIGYPDVGSNQHLEIASSGGGTTGSPFKGQTIVPVLEI